MTKNIVQLALTSLLLINFSTQQVLAGKGSGAGDAKRF